MREFCSRCTHCLDNLNGAKRRGYAAYQNSLQPGQMSMRERGKLGGRPKELTLAEEREIRAREEEIGRRLIPKEIRAFEFAANEKGGGDSLILKRPNRGTKV